jgi:hypothetical protein
MGGLHINCKGKARTRGDREQGVRRALGRNRDEAIKGSRKRCSEKPHNFYSSPNITSIMKTINEMEMTRSRNGEMRNACELTVDKPEWTRLLDKDMGRLKNDI